MQRCARDLQQHLLCRLRRQQSLGNSSPRRLCSQLSAKPARPDVRKLADMAQISVTDQEAEDWQVKIDDIIGWFDQLQAVDVSSIEPVSALKSQGGSRLRPDVSHAYENRDALMEALPSRQGDYAKVPKVLNTET